MTNINGILSGRPGSQINIGALQLQSQIVTTLVKKGLSVPGLTGGFDVITKDENLVISRWGENETVVGKLSELLKLDNTTLSEKIFEVLLELSK